MTTTDPTKLAAERGRVSDEMLAAYVAWEPPCELDVSRPARALGLIRAAFFAGWNAALRRPTPPPDVAKARPLRWYKPSDHPQDGEEALWVAHGIGGRYSIQSDLDKFIVWTAADEFIFKTFDSVEACKAWAEADWQAAIVAALASQDAPSVAGGMVERYRAAGRREGREAAAVEPGESEVERREALMEFAWSYEHEGETCFAVDIEDAIAAWNTRFDTAELERENAALREENDRLQDVLDTERYKVAIGVQGVSRAVQGRRWLSQPGRGSFAWDDDEYQQEFGRAIEEIEASLKPLLAISQDWSDCPRDPLRVASNRERARNALGDQPS